VDLAGGTLDIWPLGLLHRGARTVNVAIDLAARVELTRRASGYRLTQGESVTEAATASDLAKTEEGALFGLVAEELGLPPVDIHVASGSPRGAGLGASSALGVAAVAAGERLAGNPAGSALHYASLVGDLEARLMGLPTGRQDQFAALLGGALEIPHGPGGHEPRRLDVDLASLGDSLVVAYSGQSHFSAGNNWQVVKARLDGDPKVVAAFEGIARAAAQLPAALERGDLAEVGRLMSAEWSHRRRLAPEVSTPRVEGLLEEAEIAGAWGGKVCGAGGGGCVAVVGPAESRERIARRLAGAGAEVLEAKPVGTPLEIEVLAP
jgi:D-glycero-alpha-D-manno-heptose-7-phosphate kinase